MSLLNNLFGNATEVDIEELRKEFGEILINGEDIETAFRIFRDKWVFPPAKRVSDQNGHSTFIAVAAWPTAASMVPWRISVLSKVDGETDASLT